MPWVKANKLVSGITAHLFYYDIHNQWRTSGLGPMHIYTDGGGQSGQSTKILWITPNRGSGRNLTVTGTRTDAPGSFKQIFPGAGYYPSIVNVPDAGCWKLALKTGRLTGTILLIAEQATE